MFTMEEAKKLHAHVLIIGIQQQELNLRKLITFFAITNPTSLPYARLIFNTIKTPSTFLCNTLIRAYSKSHEPHQAFHLHNQMRQHNHPPDNYTFTFLLKASSSLFQGEQTHSELIKYGFGSDIYVQNCLIHLYGSNGRVEMSRRVFDEMGVRDIASWTSLVSCYANFGSIAMARNLFDEMPDRTVVSYSAMITGYVRRGQFKEALELFHGLQVERMEPNDSMIMSVLCACARVGALDMGRWVHSYIIERRSKELKFDSRTTTALIDMYFKCGSVDEAVRVFVGSTEKLVGEWTAMISGMAMHGFGDRCVQLFEAMLRSGVKPNVVTFVALLSGCAHAGLVDEGLGYYERMKYEFGIVPLLEHFGCVVDLLARAGFIDRAVEFIGEMPMEANAAIWGALLNACRVHKNVEIGELAARWLVREEPWNGGIYMTLLSLHREVGRWDDVERVKKEMKEVGSRKCPGCSLIEVNGVCYEFVVGDKSCPPAYELCLKLGELIRGVKENRWYFAGTMFIETLNLYLLDSRQKGS